jgi:hypothetical protein
MGLLAFICKRRKSMSRLTASLLLCFGLLLITWRGIAAADKGQMYEDIEVMGRIFDRVLKLPRQSTNPMNVYVPNVGPFNGGFGGAGLGGMGLGGLGLGGLGGGGMGFPGAADPILPSNSPVDPFMPQIWHPQVWQPQLNFGGGLGGFQGGGGNMISVPIPAYPKAQGTYVKGHGIVFTITLPPPASDPKPTAIPARPKPATEWDRVRQELHGEKPEAAAKKAKAKEPSVADLVLETLAKNGHHFAQLGEKESLTVSIVFRPEDQQVNGGQTVAAPDPEAPAPASGGEGAGGGAVNDGDKKNDRSAAGGQGEEPSTPRDYELLGDLHLKQGQSKDALKAYQKAAEKNPDPKHAAAIHLKIAQIYLAAENNKTEAEKALDKAREFLAKAQTEPAKKETRKGTIVASPLPARLIITASKELLDRAGREQISLAEFKKAATVEYLPFSQDAAPSLNR